MFNHFTDIKSSYQSTKFKRVMRLWISCTALLFMCPQLNSSEGPTFTVRLSLCPHLSHKTQLSQIQHKIFIFIHFEKAMCEKIRGLCNLSYNLRFHSKTSCQKVLQSKQKSNYQNISYLFFMECCHLKQTATMIFNTVKFEKKI